MPLYYNMTSDELEEKRLLMLRVHYEQAMADIDIAPYWQWTCVVDPSTCPECAALNDKVFRYNDPIWQRYMMRIHLGCRCSFRAYSDRDINKKNLSVTSSLDLGLEDGAK